MVKRGFLSDDETLLRAGDVLDLLRTHPMTASAWCQECGEDVEVELDGMIDYDYLESELYRLIDESKEN